MNYHVPPTKRQPFHTAEKKMNVIWGCMNRSAICKMCEITLLLYLVLKASARILRPDLGTALHGRCGVAKRKRIAGSLVSIV